MDYFFFERYRKDWLSKPKFSIPEPKNLPPALNFQNLNYNVAGKFRCLVCLTNTNRLFIFKGVEDHLRAKFVTSFFFSFQCAKESKFSFLLGTVFPLSQVAYTMHLPELFCCNNGQRSKLELVFTRRVTMPFWIDGSFFDMQEIEVGRPHTLWSWAVVQLPFQSRFTIKRTSRRALGGC